MMTRYENYYVNQAGSGVPVYQAPTSQRGHGIASFLTGIARTVFPFFRSAGKTALNEAARTGLQVLSDVSADTPLRESFETRVKEAKRNVTSAIKRKLKNISGEGYKRRKTDKTPHSRPSRRPKRTSKKKESQIYKSDLFK